MLSYVPPMTPMVMVLRLSSGTDIWLGEVVLSILVLIVGVLATVWAAAKVFRTGILMYGKRPALHEILRWLRKERWRSGGACPTAEQFSDILSDEN